VPNANLGSRTHRHAPGKPDIVRHQSVYAPQVLDQRRAGFVDRNARVARVDVGIIENEVISEPAPDCDRTIAEAVPGASAAGMQHLENHRHEMRSR
jgi:hypothetical protein